MRNDTFGRGRGSGRDLVEPGKDDGDQGLCRSMNTGALTAGRNSRSWSSRRKQESALRCPHCSSATMKRLISRFTSIKSEEARLESLTDPSNLSGLDENDPASMARWLKRMGGELGEDVSKDEIDQMADEIASGKALDDGPGGGGGLEGGGWVSTLRMTPSEPQGSTDGTHRTIGYIKRTAKTSTHTNAEQATFFAGRTKVQVQGPRHASAKADVTMATRRRRRSGGAISLGTRGGRHPQERRSPCPS